jgi:hypothetical protein
MSKILVIGVDHFLQSVESICTTPVGKESEAIQKAALRAHLEELIARQRPQLIAEEAKLDRDCMGKHIADLHGCKYCNLTMPQELRSKAGVPSHYNDGPDTQRIAYEIFEAYMFEQVQKSRRDAESILVICGSYHVAGLARLFAGVEDDVDAEDTYDAEWYQSRPLESDGKVKGFYKEVYRRGSF